MTSKHSRPFLTRLLRKLPLDAVRAEAAADHGLRRSLSARDLVLLGIGAIIGTGIFVLTGRAAAVNAGPAVSLSFILAGIVAALAGLCYSEMASMFPAPGSAYVYAYATMGELVAWMIGWDLVLEYLVAAAAVSVGFSGYLGAFLQHAFGVTLPASWTQAPISWTSQAGETLGGHFVFTGSVMNLPAALVVLFVTALLVVGIRESARFNAVAVVIKVVVVLLFIGFAAPFVRSENFVPFIPPNTGVFGHFGWSGVLQGATMVFFAYVGFDAVSTAASETHRPERALPIGILGSLSICAILYVAVAVVLTGVVPYQELNVPHPISVGIARTGIAWLTFAVELGALAGLTSVLVVLLMGQPRIFFAMARDGLLPAVAARIHPRFGTPHVTTLGCGFACAVTGALLPIEVLAELTSIGTLFAFAVVCGGVLILRLRHPELPRAFRVPGGPWFVPLLGVLSSVGLMLAATPQTLLRLVVWLFIGLCVYFTYGYRRSRLRRVIEG